MGKILNPIRASIARTELRLVLLSDTHQLESEISQVPDGDILIHAGDFTFLLQEPEGDSGL